jgi:hypothetical protein
LRSCRLLSQIERATPHRRRRRSRSSSEQGAPPLRAVARAQPGAESPSS